MKIRTKLMGEIELETMAAKDGSAFIPHSALHEYIYQQMFGKVKVSAPRFDSSGNCVCATMTMELLEDIPGSNKTGWSVVGIGESMLDSENEYERVHPHRQAADRAFDNAVFLFLGIDRSSFTGGSAPAQNTTQQAKPATAAPAPVQQAPAQTYQAAPAPAPAQPAQPEAPAKEDANPFDTVATRGKYKGKTYREIAQLDRGYAQWVVEKCPWGEEAKQLFAALLQE